MKILKTMYLFCFQQSLLLWVVVVGLTSLNSVPSENSNKGCPLVPPNFPNQPSYQDDIVKFLRESGLFGRRFSCEGDTSTFIYEFAVCDAVMKDKPNVSLIKKDQNQGLNIAIGLRNSTSFSSHKGEWTMMNLGRGEADIRSVCENTSLSSSVMFICDRKYPNGEFKLLYADLQYCTYNFELRIADICGKAPGMSGWTVLFIILIVAIILYFLLGFLYLRFKKGSKGIDQIPHRNYWFGLGNFLADGCSALCRCDRYCSDPVDQLDSSHHTPYSGQYSPIGEGTPATFSAHNTDRDTTLLSP